MNWPQSESEFTDIMKVLFTDVFIPVATQAIKEDIYRDIDKMVEAAVKRYCGAIVAVSEGL